MANSERFKFKNEPNTTIESSKDWIKRNPKLARLKPEDLDEFEIEVVGYDNEMIAKRLYNTLKDTGFLDSYPLYSIKIATIN